MTRPSRTRSQRSQRAASTARSMGEPPPSATEPDETGQSEVATAPHMVGSPPRRESDHLADRSARTLAAGLPSRPRPAVPARAARRNLAPLWIGLAAVLAAALIGGLVYIAVANQVGGVEGTNLPDEGRTHIPTTQIPEYKHYPPASGPHFDAPATWGSIKEPLPEGRFVHNLEHGGIALLYKCTDQCDAVANQVQRLYQNLPKDTRFGEVKFVASPYTRMEHNFAVLAWDYIYEMDTLDTRAVESFYTAHVNKGPELVP